MESENKKGRIGKEKAEKHREEAVSKESL